MRWKSFLGLIKHSPNFCIIQFTNEIVRIILGFAERCPAAGLIIAYIIVLGDRKY